MNPKKSAIVLSLGLEISSGNSDIDNHSQDK